MEPLRYSDSIIIDASPEAVYDLVSDVTRTGEWSPICTACWWHDDGGPTEGAWFSGRNESNGRVWETKSQVVVARRPREFTWMVGGSFVRWSYTLLPVEGGTRLTESWEFRDEGIAMFHEKYGAEAQDQIDERSQAARTGIPATLQAIKRIAESR
ncbi:SRPBCC family protein [Arthrobacter castelli]|uniref:SRPBCC family protein n=1 Tax=Arthrobacter castelli TaxID=271431 RepID=UPI0003F5D701|nr:SRPBCC family protein [Arthrobacter castelli]